MMKQSRKPLRRIREAEAIGATALDLGGLDALNPLPRESLPLTPEGVLLE